MTVTRATSQNIPEGALFEVLAVAAGQSIGRGMPFMLASGEITNMTGITDKAYGITYLNETDGAWPATAGEKVTCILIGSNCIAPVKVGTGGATKGEKLRSAAANDGVTNATIGGATSIIHIVGTCVEDGVAGDIVGCNMSNGGACVGS